MSESVSPSCERGGSESEDESVGERLDKHDEQLTELKSELIEQEHRLFSLLLNLKAFWNLPEEHPYRQAALRAIARRIVLAFLPTAAAGSLGVGAILGAVLAYQANELVHRQNVFAITERAESTLDRIKSDLDALKSRTGVQDQLVVGGSEANRIIRLSLSLEPYTRSSWGVFETEQSPERGALLTLLCSYDGIILDEVLPFADFSRAALAHAELRDRDLSKIQLGGADLTDVDFTGTDLTGADLTGAVWRGIRSVEGCDVDANTRPAAFRDWALGNGARMQQE